MKKIVLLASLLCFAASLFAQDIIVTKDNERIEAKIVKTYDAVIKYALFSDPDGETFLMAKSKIVTILYEDGLVETYENAGTNNAQSNNVTANNKTAEAATEKVFKNVIRVNPLATAIAAFGGIFQVDLFYSRYLLPKLAIPVEVTFSSATGLKEFVFMTGIEAVPATHRQKSGLFLNGLVGIDVVRIDANKIGISNIGIVNGVGFVANPNIGYQLVTKNGFAFNAEIGGVYYSLINSVNLRFLIAFGFAF